MSTPTIWQENEPMKDSPSARDTASVPAEPVVPSPFDVMLKTALVPSVIAGIVTAVVALLIGGGRAGLSAGFGALLALFFFAAGLLVMRKVIDVNGVALMAAAMAVFFGQLILVILLMFAATSLLDLQPVPTVLAVAVVVLVWQGFQVLGFVRSRRPVYDPPTAGDGAA
ncbi:MAG: hypothetical protein ABI384_06725 [Allobranchiibius sp.]|nr:hypothetical protein [Actinomycetota bacterium]